MRSLTAAIALLCLEAACSSSGGAPSSQSALPTSPQPAEPAGPSPASTAPGASQTSDEGGDEYLDRWLAQQHALNPDNLSCAELAARRGDGGHAGDYPRGPAANATTAQFSIVAGTLDEDRGFGSGERLLAMVGAQRTVELPARDDFEDLDELDLDVEVAHFPSITGESWWLVEALQPPPNRWHLVVPVCISLRSSDKRIEQQWLDAQLVSLEQSSAVLLLHGPLVTREALGSEVDGCDSMRVEMVLQEVETQMSVTILNSSTQRVCLSWVTAPPPTLRSQGLPQP